MSTPPPPLCHISELSDPGSAGFAVEVNGERVLILVVRRGDDVFAYINSCPHLGVPLDMEPGRFLNIERRYILCSTHGALFRLDSGLCVAGPCRDKSLKPFDITLTDGWILPGAA